MSLSIEEITTLRSRVETLEKEVATLRTALLTYGSHQDGCAQGLDCSCGWSAIIADTLFPEEALCAKCGETFDHNLEHLGKDVPAAMGDIPKHQFNRYTPQQPETQTLCPCLGARRGDLCDPCWHARPGHAPDCTDCSGTRTEETTNG